MDAGKLPKEITVIKGITNMVKPSEIDVRKTQYHTDSGLVIELCLSFNNAHSDKYFLLNYNESRGFEINQISPFIFKLLTNDL